MTDAGMGRRCRGVALAILAMAATGLAVAPGGSAPAHAVEDARTALHQEVTIAAPPMRVYDALLDSKSFAGFTGMPARIDRRAGGATWLFGGLVTGRNVELVPGRRIVQAWRTVREWKPGVYSLVRFELQPRGSGTLLVLDQTGFPPGNFAHLDAGWPLRYWAPLKKFLATHR
ncbi:MAG TPA: SRPBCC domain-containing protein [Allosphingosinicella sp.]|jgi:uncharacterized protein YndB with AHSA1/START domain